jgi:hypothetical protein
MSIETLSLAAGALLSLLFSYVPGVKGWFDAKDSTVKRLIMACALLLISVLIFAAGCAGVSIPGSTITCSVEGAWALVQIFLLALVANQGLYNITTASSKKAAS